MNHGAVALLLLMLGGCASLPQREAATPSTRFAHPEETALGRIALEAAGEHEGLSGVRVLDGGYDAFIERAALIEAAQRSIDAQYYIWNSDRTGRYLAARIHAAAERGVRVRLLIDDINVAGRDAVLAALDSHRNIELRIYNPSVARSGVRQTLGFLREWTRMNRRMHNKSFTVDGAVAIVGGRNIGDEYFDASTTFNFSDRDVVTAGPVVDAVGAMFDQFWNSELAYSVSQLASDRLPDAAINELIANANDMAQPLTDIGFQLPVGAQHGTTQFKDSLARAVWAPVRLVHDAPPNANNIGGGDELQPSALAFGELVRGTQEELLIESAYLVLDDRSLEGIKTLIDSGVRVIAQTNSLASNDVTANHAAYARKRKAILESGIELYELRPDAPACAKLVVIGCDAAREFGLHAKSFVFDRRTVWVGSFNLNLRSAYLNAEAGMIIDSPELAASIARAIVASTQQENSWRVRLVEGEVRWSSADETFTHEPESGWMRRLMVAMIAALPLEKYL